MHRFEDLAQRLIEGSLARLLGERLQPNAVLRALVQAIEDAETVDAHGNPVAPNHFWVHLSEQDLAPLEYFHPNLADQLAESLRQIMLHMGLHLDAAPRVFLRGVQELAPRQISVVARWIPPALPISSTTAQFAQAISLPRRPFVIVDGRRQIALTDELVRIGRSRENDIVVDDRRVSRHHLELRWQRDLEKFLCVDLGSTGGTKLNGYPIQQCTLEAGDVLSLGGVEIIYGEEFALHSTLGALT
ncbi:MAG: DUF3662 domain-containing protein [Anaerolineae bacterium]|nr:FHA domain-containing protein [Thermoflexales bacterium]MDW8406409.1 DUF3662 domain-containing protein [Anaerolineae bacterium]